MLKPCSDLPAHSSAPPEPSLQRTLCLLDWIPQASLARWEICQRCHPFWTRRSRATSSIWPLRVFVPPVPPSVPDVSTRWALKSPELCGSACRSLCDRQRDGDSIVLPRTKAFSRVGSGINDPEVQMDPVHISLMFSYFCSVPWAAGSLGGGLSCLSWSPLEILILEPP